MVDVPGRLYFKDEEVYSDWFDRLGDNIIVRGEAIDSNTGAADLKIEVYTKNREDTTKGAKPTSWDLTLDSSSLGTIQETILAPRHPPASRSSFATF